MRSIVAMAFSRSIELANRVPGGACGFFHAIGEFHLLRRPPHGALETITSSSARYEVCSSIASEGLRGPAAAQLKESAMTTASITGTDIRVRGAVVRQLDWDPEVDASAIGVSAGDSVVTLTGFVDSYAEKLAAERVAKQVRGVRGVANDIVVRQMVGRTDADIAHDAVLCLAQRPDLAETIQATVHHGHLTLTGQVSWLLQREAAEHAVKHVRGLLGIFNHITVRPGSTQRDVRRRIVTALHHNADLDARHISVAVHDDTVTLTGMVGTWMQRDAAERAAGSAAGVVRVENQLVVVPAEPHDEAVPDEMC
jgi:osmotically-inducible protein OsmY